MSSVYEATQGRSTRAAKKSPLTLRQRAQAYNNVHVRGATLEDTAAYFDRSMSRISEIATLSDYEGKRAVNLPAFLALVAEECIALDVQFVRIDENNLPVYAPRESEATRKEREAQAKRDAAKAKRDAAKAQTTSATQESDATQTTSAQESN